MVTTRKRPSDQKICIEINHPETSRMHRKPEDKET
jgi:hypothetical protein